MRVGGGSGIESERDFATEDTEHTEEDNAETLSARRFAEIFGGNG